MHSDSTGLPTTREPTTVQGEPLTFHGPGWLIRTDDYEVICWAPGPVIHDGQPTGKVRGQWLLSLELRPSPLPPNVDEGSAGRWTCGSFVTGASLAAVVPALVLLDESDRLAVTSELEAELGEGATA